MFCDITRGKEKKYYIFVTIFTLKKFLNLHIFVVISRILTKKAQINITLPSKNFQK